MSNCIEPTNIIPNNNQVVLQDVNKTITVIDNNCCTTTNITQPITNVIQVNTLGIIGPSGPQGPQGDPGPSGSSLPFIDLGNGVWATTSSIQVTGSLTISGSSTLINIGPTIFSGSLIVTSGITGSLSGSITEAISSSYALTASYALNGGGISINTSSFATTGSNIFKGNQTIHGNLFMSGSFPLVYSNNPTNNILFGHFDGSTIHGPYLQIFGNQYPNISQRGGAEIIYDIRNGGDANFHISSFNGSSWTQKFRVDDNGVQIAGSLKGNDLVAYGNNVTALGQYSHAEGIQTTSSGYAAHAEGYLTKAIGLGSHAEGYDTQTIGNYNHAEGLSSTAIGQASHAEGHQTMTQGLYSHAEGYATTTGYISDFLDSYTDGSGNIVISVQNLVGFFPIGEFVTIIDDENFYITTVEILDSIYSGGVTTLQLDYINSYVGYILSSTTGQHSHAEGLYTRAIGDHSHAEGYQTKAIGNSSHAEGYNTQAIGEGSHAEGRNTIASGQSQTVVGKYNIIGNTTDLFVVGGGDEFNRKDVLNVSTSSVTINNLLTLIAQHPLPSGVPSGSFAVSSSNPPKPYFYDGISWNALY